MKNYIDEKGNYINIENLSLRQIYENGIETGKTETPKGDSISRSALKEGFKNQECWNVVIAHIIDNAPTVSDRYDEGYAQGYIDGSTGADWKGGAE